MSFILIFYFEFPNFYDKLSESKEMEALEYANLLRLHYATQDFFHMAMAMLNIYKCGFPDVISVEFDEE